jgi:hypothetical protein
LVDIAMRARPLCRGPYSNYVGRMAAFHEVDASLVEVQVTPGQARSSCSIGNGMPRAALETLR